MSIKYLLLKLAEEAGEVVVAAIKHRIHKTPGTRDELSKEVGDFLAVVQLLGEAGGLSPATVTKQREERYDRERKRARGS